MPDVHPTIIEWAREKLELATGTTVNDVTVQFNALHDDWSDGYNNGGGGVSLDLFATNGSGEQSWVTFNLMEHPDQLLPIIGEMIEHHARAGA